MRLSFEALSLSIGPRSPLSTSAFRCSTFRFFGRGRLSIFIRHPVHTLVRISTFESSTSKLRLFPSLTNLRISELVGLAHVLYFFVLLSFSPSESTRVIHSSAAIRTVTTSQIFVLHLLNHRHSHHHPYSHHPQQHHFGTSWSLVFALRHTSSITFFSRFPIYHFARQFVVRATCLRSSDV